jgi:hypothetical protein
MNILVDAAFGPDPGRWPLPSAGTPREYWLRAVAAAGQGRYAAAMADLDALDRVATDPSLTSLACSTRASLLRQLGGHLVARSWDGRAWALAGSDVDAGADALIGLAADALGVGRFTVSRRLLRRADDLLGGAGGRLAVRLAWVGAELAMVTGDGASAVAEAERAVELAAGLNSSRHAVKSQVVMAAALSSAGAFDESRAVADAGLISAERWDLIPLNWALACILTDVGSSAHSPSEICARRERLADTVRDRGGVWTAR